MKVNNCLSLLLLSLLSSLSFLLLLLLNSLIVVECELINGLNITDGMTALNEVKLSPKQLVELRGFLAQNHYVVTKDGYILNLIQVTNPLINKGKPGGLETREPILVIHGVLADGKYFIANSIGAKPHDYSQLDINDLNDDELDNLINEDPSFNSIVFGASNCGHDVWILARRGAPGSQGHVDDTKETMIDNEILDSVGLYKRLSTKTVDFIEENMKYWNYSLDEQAKFDVPEVIDFILKETKRPKLVAIGHSAGGALLLMTMTLHPDLNDKLSKVLLYAPALDLPSTPEGNFLINLAKIFHKPLFFLGGNGIPIPPRFLFPLYKTFFAGICFTQINQDTLCDAAFDLTVGKTGHQQNYVSSE